MARAFGPTVYDMPTTRVLLDDWTPTWCAADLRLGAKE